MRLNTNLPILPNESALSNQKRSICLINDSFPPVIDGVANAVINYASVIQRDYGNATVVTPYYPNAGDSAYPFPVLRYPSIDITKLVGYRAGFPLSPKLMAQVEGRHIDLIHSHCPITSTVLARMLRQRLHVPLVFTYHTKFDIDIANAIHNKQLQEASIKLLVENISACDEVWTVSHGAGENLRSLGYQGEYIVMPNGVDFPAGRLPEEKVRAVSQGLDLPDGVPLLLFVGRMMWYKGLRIILDALKQLKEDGPDFRMAFVGKGTDGEAIRAYAKELCLDDKVFFLEPCYDREIIRAWYCRADLFLFPSTFDTNGLVVREAAACGLASVLIAGSCAAEDITDGQNGFFIEENAVSMAEMLRRLLPRRELMRQVGENAQREIYISWDTSVANACHRYEVVLDNFRRGMYPAHDAWMDELLLGTAESLDAINRLRAIPHQLRATMDEDSRQWHDEIHKNRLNAQEECQKLQAKLSQLCQRIDRYL